MKLRIIISSIVIASTAFGQEPKLHDERLVRELMDYYGISAQTALSVAHEPHIATLAPVLSYLEERFGSRPRKKVIPGGIREIHKPFALVLREDGKGQTFNGGWIDIWLTDTSVSVGKAAAVYLSRLAVRFEKDSFSGVPVGEWAAHYSEDPCILFFRRNALVRVSCDRAIEISKIDKSKRGVPDPAVIQTCEDLARDIDAQLLKLPVAVKEVK